MDRSRRWGGVALILVLAFLGVGLGLGGILGGGGGQPEVIVEVGPQNDVTPTPTPAGTPTPEGQSGTPTPGGSGGGSTDNGGETENGPTNDDGGELTARGSDPMTTDAGDDGGMSLRVRGDEMSGQVDSVMPGDSGNVSLDVTNVGNRSGRVSVAIRNVTDFENGLTEPELDGGDAGSDPGKGGGELSSNLHIRWSIEGPEGEREYLFGSESGYRPIGSLDGETGEAMSPVLEENESATALFEWKVPRETGNAIQGDSIRFDADFTLTAPGEAGSELQQ